MLRSTTKVRAAFPLRCSTDGGPMRQHDLLDPYHPNDSIKFGGSPAIVDGSIWILTEAMTTSKPRRLPRS
jgi:hypothetical protein